MYYLSKIIKLLLMDVSYKVNKMSYLLLKITFKGSYHLNLKVHILGNVNLGNFGQLCQLRLIS